MPNLFDTAHAFTARWEGGLTDHPADPGGLTKYGVSLRWVQDLAQQARQECLRQHRSCDGCSAARTPNCTYNGLDLDMDGDGEMDAIDVSFTVNIGEFMTHPYDEAALVVEE